MNEKTEKTVYLHPGTSKAATTFLQKVLWQTFADSDGDIYFPRTAAVYGRSDPELRRLVAALKPHTEQNRTVVSLLQASLLTSLPVRLLGRFFPKKRSAPPAVSPAPEPEPDPQATEAGKPVPALFLHIRKTGGTSIVRQAMDHYGYENVCGHGDYMGRSPKSLTDLPFVAGHFGFDYARTLMPGRFSFTFLRDPIERILSLYSFCRIQDPEEFPIYRAAAEHDLEGFLRAADDDDLVRAYVWNSQVWCLAAGPGYVETLETVAQPEAMFARALENIEQLSFVGLTETFDVDARQIMQALNMNAGQGVRKDNVTRDKIALAGLSDRTIHLLEELTHWDRKLYDIVRRSRRRR